jgi:hypothetical protein
MPQLKSASTMPESYSWLLTTAGSLPNAAATRASAQTLERPSLEFNINLSGVVADAPHTPWIQLASTNVANIYSAWFTRSSGLTEVGKQKGKWKQVEASGSKWK